MLHSRPSQDAAIFFLLPGSEGDAEDQRSPKSGRQCLPAYSTSAPPAPTLGTLLLKRGISHGVPAEQASPSELPSASQVPKTQRELFIRYMSVDRGRQRTRVPREALGEEQVTGRAVDVRYRGVPIMPSSA